MRPYRKNRVPAYYGLRIYLLSTLLYFFLVFPVAGILIFREMPDLIESKKLKEIPSSPAPESGKGNPADSLMAKEVSALVRDTSNRIAFRIGSGAQVTQENTSEEDSIKLGGSMTVLFIMLLVSYLIGLFFNVPFKRYFRKKREKKPISQKLQAYCKRLILHTPRINMGILGLPFLVSIIYQAYQLLLTPGLDEVDRSFNNMFFFISLFSATLILFFTYFWQQHRVRIYYLEHIYDDDELHKRIITGSPGRIRNKLWISAGMTTLLPLLIVVFYLALNITAVSDLQQEEFSAEQQKILLGNYSSMEDFSAMDDSNIRNLFYVNAINSLLMIIGIGTGVFLAIIYLVFFVRWATQDIVFPVSELLANMQRTGRGELERYAIVRTSDEIGELTEGYNEMTFKLKNYFNKINEINIANSRFVPKQFLDFLGKESIVDIRLGDQVMKEMTVLFTDIRDFTTLSEQMTPKENFDFLNNYLGYMEPVIRNNNGFIDKYIGDSIMALFPHDAEEALNAAIEMRIKLTEFNQIMGQFNKPAINSGIGIHTGSLMLGVVGGEGRMDGTVISDAVNLTSRIEGLTKIYGCAVILTEDTLIRLKDPSMYNVRFLDIVRVKGKRNAVYIFELLDSEPEHLRLLKIKTKEQFGIGLQAYKKRDFETALYKFMEIAAINDEDMAAKLYIQRCRRYMTQGVPDDWDGAEAIDYKF